MGGNLGEATHGEHDVGSCLPGAIWICGAGFIG